MINQQLEQLSLIGRCDYQKTCAVLISYFDQSANAYQVILHVIKKVQIFYWVDVL